MTALRHGKHTQDAETASMSLNAWNSITSRCGGRKEQRMNIFTKLRVSVQEQRKMEDTQATLEKLAANQDYIAMMTDVELEEDEDDEAVKEEE